MTENGQFEINDIFTPDILFGRTSSERCQVQEKTEKAKILELSLKKPRGSSIKMPQFLDLRGENGVTAAASWVTGGALLGEYMMHSFGESPREENVSRLSQILETSPHPKYSLSAKACQGILNRAERRGKALPPRLKAALESQIHSLLKLGGGAEYDSSGKKAGKGALIQTELSATLGLAQDQTLIQTFRKTAYPRNNEEAQGYEETQTNDTLNGCDNTEARTPTIICQTYDARGNGDGETVCTITGDHNNRITDYTSLILKDPQDVITTSYGGFMVNADDSGIAHTLEATDHKDPQIVAYGLDRASYNQGKNAQYDFSIDEEKISTQVAKGPGAVLSSLNSIVRRLTPMECERLQGYPDNWTNIGEWTDSKGKLHKDADSPRYKALGNSIALPFWAWMAERMVKYCGKDDLAMASLFDGIGGFPLVFSRVGVKPVWASEIEEFCIAVTKKHFPE